MLPNKSIEFAVKQINVFFKRRYYLIACVFPPALLDWMKANVSFGNAIEYAFIAVLLFHGIKQHRACAAKTTILLFAFLLLCTVQFMIAPSESGENKLLLLAEATIVFYTFGIIVASDAHLTKAFQIYIGSASVALSLLTILLSFVMSSDAIYRVAHQSQTISYYISMGIVLFAYGIFNGGKLLVPLIALSACTFALVLTGNISSIAALFFTATVPTLYFVKQTKKPLKVLIPIGIIASCCLALSGFYFAATKSMPFSFYSILVKSQYMTHIISPKQDQPLPSLEKYYSSSYVKKIPPPETANVYSPTRLDMITASLSIWKQCPIFGVGLGNWQSHFDNYYQPGYNNDYPHNIIAELLSETGLVGLFLFCGVLICALLPLSNIGANRVVFFAKSGLIFWLCIQCFSSDITNRWLYIFIGLSANTLLPLPGSHTFLSVKQRSQ